MKLLLIIPAYNEGENLERVVGELIADYPQFDYVVVNDGSRDNTADICRQNGYNMLDLPINCGLEGAFQAGMKYALKKNYDCAIQYDGDGQHNPAYIASMLDCMEKTGSDIVIGSRFKTQKKPRSFRMLGSAIIQTAIRVTTHHIITDPTSGMRLFSRRMIRLLATMPDMGPEPDTVAYLIRSGAKVAEVQVEMSERIAGESYLNLSRSIQYMLKMSISIYFIQWFRKKSPLD